MGKRIGVLAAMSTLAVVWMVAMPAPVLAQDDDTDHARARAMAKAVTDAVYAMPDYTAFSNVDFHITADGTVNLTGMSARKELKANICGVIEDIDGVTECTDNLYQLSTSRVDREIRIRIYDSIYRQYLSDYATVGFGQRAAGGTRFMGPHAIHIIEDKQHVYLYGYVFSEEDKASVTHAVNVTPGVADVKNYLRVVPKPDGS